MSNQPTPVYEWFRFDEVSNIPVNQTHGTPLFNPPFFPGPAGRVQSYMTNGPILRGFIKRSLIDGAPPANDIGARGRCYFMFNPTSLSQAWNYDASTYLAQQTSAADLSVTAAGQGAFNFALLFERQIEVAHNPDHAGVLVDIDLLSYIIRGVPSSMAGTTAGAGVHIADVDSPLPGSAPADPSGVFIGQGLTIDAVFSKFMTVRGLVQSLQVEYVKFSHRMVPTMCWVNVGMLVQAQSVGTQGIPDIASPPPATTDGAGAGTGDPNNRYGAGGTGP